VFGRRFDVGDLNHERGYGASRAYGEGKLANILFTRELHRRFHADGLAAVAFHPGVVRSNFASEAPLVMRLFYQSPLRYLGTISSETSGRRLTALAEGAPGVDWQPGEVYDGARPMPVAFKDPDGRVARELWERSEHLLGLAA
jgi:NAD(P)-dependent dehydrogenase (short-subunit alcohol dehydrogenase family)